MNDKKDFKHEAQEPVIVNNEDELKEETHDIEIEDVIFLTPARVEFTHENGTEDSISVAIDLVSRKVYVGKGPFWTYSDKVFEYLDRVNILPENFFEASEDIYNEANKAVDEMEQIRKNTL